MAEITGLNHITLAVSNLNRALAFYEEILGCALRARWPSGAYLEAGPLWLCLAVGPVTPREDYTHIAFSVDQDAFEPLAERIRAACRQWQLNSSEGSSVYMLDPDGHRLELHVGSLTSRLAHHRERSESDVKIYGTTPAQIPPACATEDGLVDVLVTSWTVNADRWSKAVRSSAIESRRLVTDDAVVQAVLRVQPKRVLDLGCGEGWLARVLAPQVEHIVGIDVSPELIARACEAGGAEFYRASFADLVAEPGRFGHGFDAVVANFTLLDDGLTPLLEALALITSPGGALVVQTLHPAMVPPPYQDGWRHEDFASFQGEQWMAMPWYLRTIESWLRDISRNWQVDQLEEPLHPVTLSPASLLITARNQVK